MKTLTRRGNPLDGEYYSERDFVQKTVFGMLRSVQLEGPIEWKAKYPNELSEENFGGRYLFEVIHDEENHTLTYKATDVVKNKLVVSMTKDLWYHTQEDLDNLDNY